MERVSATSTSASFSLNPNQTPAHLSREVLDKLQRAMGFAQQAQNKHIVAVIGPTGTGKSTIVNHLLGKTLQIVQIAGAGRRLEVEGQPIAPISHSGTESETLFAQTYPCPGQPDKAIVDCGGFYDSRGVSDEVAVVTSIKLTLEASASAKIALCCMHGSLSTDRASHLTSMVQALLNNVSYQSMLLLVTRPLFDEVRPTTESIIEEIRYLLNGTTDPQLRRVFEFILRENGRYILLYDPLNSTCRDRFNTLIEDLAPLPPNSFNPAYSAEASLAILEEMVSIADRGNRLFNALNLKREAIAIIYNDLIHVYERKERYRALLMDLQRENCETFQEQRTTARAQHQTNIGRIQQEIAELRGKLVTAASDIEAANKNLIYWHQFVLSSSKKKEAEDRLENCYHKQNLLYSQVRDKENLIQIEQLAIDTINHQLENFALYQREMNEAHAELMEVQRRLAQLEQDKTGLVQAIDEQQPNLQFLVQFKALSRDERLNQTDIQECIQKHQEYRRQ